MGLWEPRQEKKEGRRGRRGAILMQMTEGKGKKEGFCLSKTTINTSDKVIVLHSTVLKF